jgi:branched-chain amino acid transport system permease protein
MSVELGAEVDEVRAPHPWWRIPAEAVPRAASAPVLVLLAVYPFFAGEITTSRFIQILLFGLVAVGMNFTMGVAGEFAIGQMGLFAAGAYTAAVLTTNHAWSFWPAVVVASLVAAVIGVIVAAPGLRVGGWAFALTSLLVAVVIPDLIRQLSSVTGGDEGLGGIPLPAIGDHMFTVTDIYVLVLASTLVILFVLWRIESSIWGLAFASLRNSAIGAQANGISTRSLKLGAYLLSSLVAGFAGAIFAHVGGFLTPGSFPFSLSILAVAAIVAGGLGTLVGPLIGMGILLYIPDLTANFDRYSLLIYGAVLIAVMLLVPDGIVPTLGRLSRKVLAKLGAVGRTGGATGATTGDVAKRQSAALMKLPPCAQPEDLVVSGLKKGFGGAPVLDGVSFDARPGEITAVIGPNGSGKTTLLNLISGYLRSEAGEVTVAGEAMANSAPHIRARKGVSRTFQTPILIPTRTARANVVCARFRHRDVGLLRSILHTPASRRDLKRLHQDALALLAAVGVSDIAEVRADALTPGQQRLVEVACAIAREPSVVLLDEPAAGLVGAEAEALSQAVLALKDGGYTVILIEHNVNLVMRISDRVIVLDQGTVIADGDPASVQADERVINSYLGRPAHAS